MAVAAIGEYWRPGVVGDDDDAAGGGQELDDFVRTRLWLRAARPGQGNRLLSVVGPPETPRFSEGLGRTARISMMLASRWQPSALACWSAGRLMARRAPGMFMRQLAAELSPADQAVLADPEVRRLVVKTSQEWLQPGVRGAVDEWLIQARPWDFRLAEVSPPVRLWHGEADRLVPFTILSTSLVQCPTGS